MHGIVVVIAAAVGAGSARTGAELAPEELVLPHALVFDEAAVAAPAGERAQSRLIYLNRNGATLSKGATDSRRNRSSLVSGQVTIPAWDADDALWSETVACVRTIFAPYGVRFTETDPGDAMHIEAIFGGNGELLGLPVRPAGVSPVSTSCRVIESSIVFAFTDDLPANARKICETIAHEIGHSYGLDHALLASDPMTYLSYSGERVFQDTLAECGETSARPCGVPGYATCREQQNSHAMLLERLGAAAADASADGDASSVTDEGTADELGCRAGGPGAGPGLVVGLLVAATARRRRGRR